MSEWKECKLREVVDFVMGASLPEESYNDNGVGIPLYQDNADFRYRFPQNRIFTTDPKRFAEKYENVITQRINEIKKTLQATAALSVIFICGSTLEGLLLDIASKNCQIFNSSNSAPKDKEGKVRHLQKWTLENLINASHETGFISLDIKKYSHSLKDFRNFIHPRQQVSQGFNPDIHTAKISWQILQAAIADLTGQRK